MSVQRLTVQPWHPLAGFSRQLGCVFLQLCQKVKRVCPAQLAGVDEAHEEVANLRAVHRFIEQRVLAMQYDTFQGTLTKVMPTPGLCRAALVQAVQTRRISDFVDCVTRHNYKCSRKASSESVGRKRGATALDGVMCDKAFSLSCMSAWR